VSAVTGRKKVGCAEILEEGGLGPCRGRGGSLISAPEKIICRVGGSRGICHPFPHSSHGDDHLDIFWYRMISLFDRPYDYGLVA